MEYHLPNVSTATTNDNTISTLLVYNGTTVECKAFIDGSPPQFTPPIAFLIQGIHTVIVMHAVIASTIIIASYP